jgi:predicted CoA-binding protein
LERSPTTGEVRQIVEMNIILREYEDIAVKDAMTVARMVRREAINTIVVNTNPHMYGRETYGFAVTKNIASITNGTHHTVGVLTREDDMIGSVVEVIRTDQKKIANEKLTNRRLRSFD